MITYIFLTIALGILLIFLIERSYRIYKLHGQILNLQKKVAIFHKDQRGFNQKINEINHASHDTLVDSLTNLISEQVFDDRFTHLLNATRRFKSSFAVMMVNIDEFNKVNVNFSHAIGDKILIEMSQRLKKNIRQVDTITRFGGDLFVILFPNVSSPEIVVYAAQRLLDTISLPFVFSDMEIKITARIGIAVYPYDGEDKKILLAHATEALTKAKKNGKNLFQFYQDETQMLGEREINLKSIISSPDFLKSISLEYQSYFNTLTDEIVCIEVSAWLSHRSMGKVHFSEFANITQNTGKILELSEWVITNAANKFKTFSNQTKKPQYLMLKFPLSQIEDSIFLNKIIQLFDSLQMNPANIIIEVSDDIENANLEILKKSFELIHARGFQIAIGILVLGHFAMKKVTNLPVNYLRLDDKFIKDINTHIESRNILEKILTLATILEIGTLTSGVDKEEQKQALQSLGCYVMQGAIFRNKNKNEHFFVDA